LRKETGIISVLVEKRNRQDACSTVATNPSKKKLPSYRFFVVERFPMTLTGCG
jgi:hypothetical protein